MDPLMLALHGGEDFELLFTVKPENVARLPKRVDGVSISQIGEITASPARFALPRRTAFGTRTGRLGALQVEGLRAHSVPEILDLHLTASH